MFGEGSDVTSLVHGAAGAPLPRHYPRPGRHGGVCVRDSPTTLIGNTLF